MGKTKRTLIFSSVVMALTLVVAIVGVSAAWFGDMKQAQQGGFIIESDTLQDVAMIDINSSQGMTGEKFYPAVAEKGYFLRTGAEYPVGSQLKYGPLPQGVEKAAQAATIFLPIVFIGTADDGYEKENRKSLDLKLQSANIGLMTVTDGAEQIIYRRTAAASSVDGEKQDAYAGTWSASGRQTIVFDGIGNGNIGGNAFSYAVSAETETFGQCSFAASGKNFTANLKDFKPDFNVEMCIVDGSSADEGFTDETPVMPTPPSYTAGTLGSGIFYDNYADDLYMLVQPGITYYVRVTIYFNKVDEDMRILDLLNATVRFNFKLNIIDDAAFIREGKYKGGQTA